jgi:hypothetical protein
MEKKGLSVEYMFLIGGLIMVLLLVSYWQQMGTALAIKNWGELKVQTTTQIKNVILLMQRAPVESETCVPLSSCDKVAVHKDYVEIWGGENEYFKEPSYLSTSLSTGMLSIYAKNEKGTAVELDDMGFVAVCGSGNSIMFVCFRKMYVPLGAGKGDYIENPAKSGFFEKVASKTGTYNLGIMITRQTDLSGVGGSSG